MPLAATPTATDIGFTAGQYRVEVDVTPAAIGSPSWVEVRGITDFGPKFGQVTEDDTDISSNGWASEFPTGNAWTASVKGLAKGRPDGTVIDPGTQFVLNAGKTTGKDGIVHLRYWRSDGIDESYEVYATATASLDGGKPPKLQEWSADFKGRGIPAKIEKPAAAGTVGATLTLNSAQAFNLGFNRIATADLTSSSTASQIQTAVRAISGMSAVAVTAGSAAGVFLVTAIPADTRLNVLSDTGTARFA